MELNKILSTESRMKELIAKFVIKDNFWGFLFSRIRRRPAPTLPSIMGVSPELDGTITLLYNPPLIDKTADDQILIVLEHEGMHLLNKHIPRLLKILSTETNEEKKNMKMTVWNWASDCTANSQAKITKPIIIDGKPWEPHLPAKYNLPDGKITEYYYYELLKKTKVVKYSGGQGFNDHSKWKDAVGGSSDLDSLARKIETYTRNMVKETVKVYDKRRGNLPGHIEDLIQDLLGDPTVPYYEIIRKLVRGTRLTKYLRCPTRINRKRTYSFLLDPEKIPQISPFPGKKRDNTFYVVILIDTSGSVSNDEIIEALSGIKNIIEKDRHCKVIVLEVDTEVEKEYTCKKLQDIQTKVKGRGGTTLGPGLLRAKELECDVCLAFTDGYTENINEIPRKYLPKKLIWIISSGGSVESVNKTGTIVRLPEAA